MKKCVVWVIFSLSFSSVILAQDHRCPTIARMALESVDRLCQETGRNRACYGNGAVDAEFTSDAEDVVFDEPGDTTDVVQLQSLRLHPMDVDEGTWGVALMNLQANLPDTFPGQGVTFVLFGDVDVETSASADDETINTEAYYFRTGVGDAPCEEAPNSGILVQTPNGVGEINLTLNDVNISLGSTAFLQAVAGGDMSVNLLEGSARVEAFGEEQRVLAGMRIRIPIDENLSATGPPSPPEMCDNSDVQALDINVNCQFLHLLIGPPGCVDGLTIPSGMEITLHLGSGYNTEAEAQAALDEAGSTISINGAIVPVFRFGPYFAPPNYTYGTNHEWGTPEPGVYTIVGVEPNATRTCTLTILEPTD